jgi:hypothetical protein
VGRQDTREPLMRLTADTSPGRIGTMFSLLAAKEPRGLDDIGDSQGYALESTVLDWGVTTNALHVVSELVREHPEMRLELATVASRWERETTWSSRQKARWHALSLLLHMPTALVAARDDAAWIRKAFRVGGDEARIAAAWLTGSPLTARTGPATKEETEALPSALVAFAEATTTSSDRILTLDALG